MPSAFETVTKSDLSLFKQNCTWTEALSPDPHEPQVMATTSPHKFDTRDTENYPLILPSVALIVITNFLFLDVYSI